MCSSPRSTQRNSKPRCALLRASCGIGAGWLVLLNIYLLQLVPKGLAWVRMVARRGTSHYRFGSFMLDTLGSVLFGPLMLYRKRHPRHHPA